MGRYVRPETLGEALALMAAEPALKVLAGGTDVYPALGVRAAVADLIDITGVAELGGISAAGGMVRIGALATWSEVVAAPLPPVFEALKLAAREVGAVQIQNVGTVAGNLCNASPAADGTVALLALGAEVEVAGPAGRRVVPLEAFVTGVRRVALQPGELVTAVLVPEQGGVSSFLKLGARKHLVISIAMVAAVLRPGADGRIASASVAVGACSPVARRLAALEARLVGALPAEAAGMVTAEDGAGLAPISDVRAPEWYRRAAVPVLVRRALADCAARIDLGEVTT